MAQGIVLPDVGIYGPELGACFLEISFRSLFSPVGPSLLGACFLDSGSFFGLPHAGPNYLPNQVCVEVQKKRKRKENERKIKGHDASERRRRRRRKLKTQKKIFLTSGSPNPSFFVTPHFLAPNRVFCFLTSNFLAPKSCF